MVTCLKQRSMSVISMVMRRLGYGRLYFGWSRHTSQSSKESEPDRSLYRRSDLAMGGIHGGIFMFRDVFARISIPLAYGQVAFKPLELTDLSPMQLKWLCSRPADLQMFMDQFTDIFDFAGGVGNLATTRPLQKKRTKYSGWQHFSSKPPQRR